MEMSVGKIVGLMGEGEWGQVHNFGDLVVVISFAGGADAGRESLTRIRELQHGEGLEKAVTTVEKEFGAEVGCVFVQGNRVFVAGNLRVWVRRKDGRSGWLKQQALVGNVEEGMTMVVGNGRFWGCVPEGMVRTMTNAEELGAVVHGGERGRGAAGAIIKFSISNVQKPEIQRLSWWKRVKMPSIRYQVPRTPKIRPIWAGVGFLVLTSLIIGGGAVWKKEVERRRSGISEKIAEIKQKFDEAKGLAGLNPVRSRELLLEIETELQSDQVTKKKDPRILGIESEMGAVKEEAMGIRRPVAEEVLDLGLVRDGMTGMKMAFGEDRLWVVGSEGRVVEVNLKQKSGKVAAQIGGGRLVASYPDKTYVLGDTGVVEILNKSQILNSNDQNLDQIKDMEVWAGNIYLLDSDQIWVYRSPEKKEKWLDETQELGKSMTIDGNIWVLGNKKILKFTSGVREGELETEGGDVIYTDDEAEKLYILDKEGGRVVAVKKTGEYDSQYVLDQAKEATDMVVDEQNKKMYLLSGAKIWEVSL